MRRSPSPRWALLGVLGVWIAPVQLPAQAAAAHAGGASTGARLWQERTPMTVEDVLALQRVGRVTISPRGLWVAYVVTVRDFEQDINDDDVWLVSAAGGTPVQLTYHDGTDTSPQWAPDGSWLAFRSNRGEHTQVFGIKPTGGEAWQVTESATPVGAFRISPDGRHIAYIATPEKSRDDEELEKVRGRPLVWDSAYGDQWNRLWVAPLRDGRALAARTTSPDSLHVASVVWAPDSRAVAFGARPSPLLRTRRLGNTYVVDVPGADARQITSLAGGDVPVAWTANLGLIISGSNRELGTFNNQLWQVPSDGKVKSLTKALDENATFVAATKDALYVEASFRTGRRLYRWDVRKDVVGQQPITVSDDVGYYSGFSATSSGDAVAFLAQSPGRPPEVHVSRTDQFGPRQLSSVNPQVDAFALGDQQVVRWESRVDGEQIEGVLTLPVGYQAGQRVPLLLVIHGGPSGVSSNAFAAQRGAYPIQVFAGLGYAVLQPNYRGSTGYGERFRGLNRGDISGRDWIDIDSGVDALIDRGIADSERLGIMGWSFGGHHTYWGITQTDRFRAASAGAGANDLISMYSQTDLPEFYHTYLGPKPWEDFALYEDRSAYRLVDRVTTPLLIQVGERDERVPAEQSIQFFEAVRALGNAPTTLVVYPGQPHGIRDPRLLRDLMSRNVEWFAKWIPVLPEMSSTP